MASALLATFGVLLVVWSIAAGDPWPSTIRALVVVFLGAMLAGMSHTALWSAGRPHTAVTVASLLVACGAVAWFIAIGSRVNR